MLLPRIILLIVILNYFVCDACNKPEIAEKRKTSSRIFQKLRSNDTKKCQYINRDFAKLKGQWRFTLRTIVRDTPIIRCGLLTVRKTSENGFDSSLLVITHERRSDNIWITGKFVNKTVIEIPELRYLITGNPQWQYPFVAQMGTCDKDSIMFIEPIHYVGGGLIFTRKKIDDINALKVRFGTFDEESGREKTFGIGADCYINELQEIP